MTKANLMRVSRVKSGELPFERTTLYKLRHLKKYPHLFIKIGGALFIDLDQLDRVIEQGRVK